MSTMPAPVTPTQSAALQFDMWRKEWEMARKRRIAAIADSIYANPVQLAQIVAKAINENPAHYGQGLQGMRSGDSFAFGARATAAVWEHAEEIFENEVNARGRQ